MTFSNAVGVSVLLTLLAMAHCCRQDIAAKCRASSRT